ncbi:MAG: hypothetical protein Q9226_003890, partial [Calogaya cf. arnoldii]
MAELSIVAFVLGSLSFGVTLRNGIERVLQDVDTYKAQIEILVPLSSRIVVQSLTWSPGAPSGTSMTEPPRNYSDPIGGDRLTRDLSRGTSRIRRANTALFTGPVFQRHLEILERSINSLHELSEKRFIENVYAFKDKDWKCQVERTATRSHLLHLADHSTTTSQALGSLVETSNDHDVDFCLDHGARPEQRQQVIIESARNRYIQYNFSISPRQYTSGLAGLKVQCQEATGSSVQEVVWDQTLPQALHKLCCGKNPPPGACTYVRAAHNAPGFVITSHERPEHVSEGLRTFMIGNQSRHDRRLQGEFSKTERTRIAYELVECALLFLRTEWFSKLCSCSIYRLESSDLKPVYTVRISGLDKFDHIDPESGSPCHQTAWCEQEPVNMHIRRLGVLLVEVAIGSPVIEVAFNYLKNDVEIDFEASGDSCTAKRKDILRRVRREGSEDLMDAVGYCLKQGTAPKDMVKADLEAFYDNVVEP